MAGIKRKLGGPRIRAFSTVLGWGALNAGTALNGIFQGALLPQRTYSGGGLVVSNLAAPSLTIPLGAAFQGGEGRLEIGVLLGLLNGKVLFFLEILGIAILASFLIGDFGRGLVSFIFSYVLGGVLVYLVLILPGLVGATYLLEALVGVSVFFTFTVFFPVPLFLGLMGTLLGIALEEKFS